MADKEVFREPDRFNKNARPGAFTRPDKRGMGTELEVSRLLADHIRALKPLVVVETGTFVGDTALVMVEAMSQNAFAGWQGIFHSFEVDHERRDEAIRRIREAKPHLWVEWHVHAATLQERVELLRFPVDIAFVDSALAAREADVETLMPRMAPNGLLFVHDAALPKMWPLARHWREIYNVVHYPTPRGLVVIQRR